MITAIVFGTFAAAVFASDRNKGGFTGVIIDLMKIVSK
jgi:hypothetical protein